MEKVRFLQGYVSALDWIADAALDELRQMATAGDDEAKKALDRGGDPYDPMSLDQEGHLSG